MGPVGDFLDNSSHLKIGKIPEGDSSSNHPFSGALAVTFREGKNLR